MKVYLDIIFLVNFIYEFLIMMSVSILLKRKTSYVEKTIHFSVVVEYEHRNM